MSRTNGVRSLGSPSERVGAEERGRGIANEQSE